HCVVPVVRHVATRLCLHLKPRVEAAGVIIGTMDAAFAGIAAYELEREWEDAVKIGTGEQDEEEQRKARDEFEWADTKRQRTTTSESGEENDDNGDDDDADNEDDDDAEAAESYGASK